MVKLNGVATTAAGSVDDRDPCAKSFVIDTGGVAGTSRVEKSASDRDRSYRHITLANGLRRRLDELPSRELVRSAGAARARPLPRTYAFHGHNEVP